MSYLPGDSDSWMFGGNSQLARAGVGSGERDALHYAIAHFRMASYYGDCFKLECPTGSGNQMTLLLFTHFPRENIAEPPEQPVPVPCSSATKILESKYMYIHLSACEPTSQSSLHVQQRTAGLSSVDAAL